MEKREIDRLYDWSAKYDGNYRYSEVGEDVESYFVQHDGNEYIMEYKFETIADLKMELEKMWIGNTYMEEIIKPVSVAAMKNKPKRIENEGKTRSLDDYIYIF